MNKILFIALFLFSTLGALFAQETTDIYIKAGSFYDSRDNKLLKNKVIHISGNRIISIDDSLSIPENAEVIDLLEYTVLPGLIDSHTHVLFSQDADEDFSEHSIHSLVMETDGLRTLRGAKRARSYLDVGITSIKDIGNSGLFLDVALRDAINEGTVDGPRIFASGPILAAAGGQIYGIAPAHQNLIELEYRIIKSEADARNAVREHVNQKVDLIKVCADNLPNDALLTANEMKAIVETAHAHGLMVTAHSVSNQSAWNAVKAGVDGIEHGFNMADSTIVLMAKNNVFLVPTENSRKYSNIYAELAGMKPEDRDWINRYMDNTKSRLTKAIQEGVPIVAGSDNYTDIGGTRGESSSDMFRAYFEAGMVPLDILQSATYLGARYMNKENEIGCIQPNAFADIIAVKGDLTTDFISTIQDIVFVMKDGVIYTNEVQ